MPRRGCWEAPEMNGTILARRNAEPAPLADVPLVPLAAFRSAILDAVRDDCRVASYFARQVGDGIELVAVLADDTRSELGFVRSRITDDRFESLTPECPQVQLFEREIAEQYG